MLADGLRLHDEQPALALQHIVAARDRVAAPDLQVKAAIDQALSEMCAKGRVANIGKDVIRFRPNKDYSALVVGYYDGPAELWHVANATSVKIPGEGTMQCEFYGPNHGVFVVTQREGVSQAGTHSDPGAR